MKMLHQTTVDSALSVAATGHRIKLLAHRLGFRPPESVRLGVATRELLALLGARSEVTLRLDSNQAPCRLIVSFDGIRDPRRARRIAAHFFDDVEIEKQLLTCCREVPDSCFDPDTEWFDQTGEILATATASELRVELEQKNRELEQMLLERAEQARKLRKRNRELQAANIQLDRMREREYRLARFDLITGLPTRTLFHDRLKKAIQLAYRHSTLMAVLFVDLDFFKQVNDTLGHTAGDYALHQIGLRMANCVRRSDTVARMGGDEFAVVLQKLQARENASLVADKLIAAVRKPITFEDREIQLGASIGIALYPGHGEKAGDLINRADAAMYAAKRAGRNRWCVFSPDSISLPSVN